MLKKLVCEICGEVIGQFDPEKLSLPLRGSMFQSKDPEHGFPPPFPDEVDWEFMRCRMCGKRPLLEPNSVMTTEGYHKIDQPRIGTEEAPIKEPKVFIEDYTPPTTTATKVVIDGFICPVCNRSFTKRMALVGHMKGHSKKYEGKPRADAGS